MAFRDSINDLMFRFYERFKQNNNRLPVSVDADINVGDVQIGTVKQGGVDEGAEPWKVKDEELEQKIDALKQSIESGVQLKGSLHLGSGSNEIGRVKVSETRRHPISTLKFEVLAGRSMIVMSHGVVNGKLFGIDHGWFAESDDGWVTKRNGKVNTGLWGIGQPVRMKAWSDESLTIITANGKVVRMQSIDDESPTVTLDSGIPFVGIGTDFWSDGINNYVLVGGYRQGSSEPQPLYLSTDGGDTFSQIWETGSLGEVNNHWHSVRFDPYTGGIWVSQGDGANARTSVSWDMGYSWHDVQADTRGQLQPTLIHAFPNRVVFGRDAGSTLAPGLDVYERDTLNRHPVDIKMKPLMEFRTDRAAADFYPEVKEMCYPRPEEAYIGFRRKAGGDPGNMSYVWATGDGGLSWYAVYAGILPIYLLGWDDEYLYANLGSAPPVTVMRSPRIEWSE